jgi:plastocyanin
MTRLVTHSPGSWSTRALGTVALVATLAVGPAAACSSATTPRRTTNTDATGTRATGAPDEVTIKDFDFVPVSTAVKVGDTVSWTNADVADHWIRSAPASPEAYDLGRQRPGAGVSHRFTKPGSYRYYCNLHNYMKGTVVVS